MKTRDRLWQLAIFFIMAVCAAVHAAEVTERDILTAAQKWIADNAIFKAEAAKTVPKRAMQLTDADGKAMPLWRVDLAPTGYLVMSSDDTLPPVVTFNMNGSFELPKGHPLPFLLKRQSRIFQEELGRPQTRGNEFAQKNQARWNALLGRTRASASTMPSEIITEPMLESKWHQSFPYDYLAPFDINYDEWAAAGCIPVAISQLLKYHEWPVAGTGSNSYTDYYESPLGASLKACYSFPYDWSLIANEYPELGGRAVTRLDWAVSRLVMEMGVLVEVDYEVEGTGTGDGEIQYLLVDYLGYSEGVMYGQFDSSWLDDYTPAYELYPRIREDMVAGRPALVGTADHEFVADGLGTIDDLDYYHFNYGWGGECNGWYLLTDGYEYSSAEPVITTATTNIIPKPVPVFKPMSVEQTSSFTLSWDFPKRLTAEAFRLTKTSGSTSTVITSSIAGTARSYSLTGQSGTATYTLEAKVDGVWQEASDGVTVTVKTDPTPMLYLMVKDELNGVEGQPFTATVSANNTLQSLTVSCSRPDMVPDSSITVTGSGKKRTISFTPSKGLLGNAILYFTGVDNVGNVVKQTVLLRVWDDSLIWNYTFSDAQTWALLTGRLILMVSGEETNAATVEFINTVCEDADVKALLLQNYELWYSSIEGRSTYAGDLGESRPFIAVIDPSGNGTRLFAHGGPMTTDETLAFLNDTTPYFSLDGNTTYGLSDGSTLPLVISVADQNAEIRYRLDSSTPMISDTFYSSPILLTSTTTVSVRAFKNGSPVSGTVTKTFTVLPQVAAPVLNADERQVFSESFTVTATCATAGATMRYTTDGSIPTTASTAFPSTGLTVASNLTLKVRAFKDGMKESEIAISQLYFMNGVIAGDGIEIVDDETDWFMQDETYVSAPYAMQSKAIGSNRSTTLTVTVTGVGELSFYWKVSSESICDELIFSIDGWEEESISGEVDWEQRTFSFTSGGEHRLTWTYSKDGSVNDGSDCGWVDDIIWTQKEMTNHTLTVTNGTGSGSYMTGTSVTATAGAAPSEDYAFGSWTVEGMTLDDDQLHQNPLTFDMPFSDVTLMANYVYEYSYTISEESVTITGYKGTKTEVVIPATILGKPVVTIAAYAFSGCSKVTSVTIPASVTNIGNYAFNSCTSLVSIVVDAANANYTSVDGVLFNKSRTTLVRYPPAKEGTEYSIPSSVTAIGIGAFNYCSILTSVTIPQDVTSISSYAFSYCSSLTSVTIPEGVTSIGGWAFNSCSSLTSVTIPSSVTSIGNYAFNSCSSLTSVTISEGVTSIGYDAFEYCTSLTSVTIPSSVTSIGSWAFYGCRNLSEMEFLGAPPTFSSLSYPTPITFRVHSGMGWEDWSVPSRVTLEILQDVHTQTIELTAGWNWVAFNVLPDSRKAADALGSEGFTANDIIQTSGGMARFSGSAWGDLTLEFGRLYQIYVANDVTVEVSGDACETSAVLLTSGWNWIGNVTTEAISPSLLTHSGGWTAGDRIQTPGKNVIYTGEKWIPDGAVTLEPGKGCQIHTAKGGWLAFPALYAVVDLSGGPDAESYPVRYSLNGPNLSSDKCRTTELWLRKIPAGTFIMGSPEDEVGRSTNETQHQVVLTQDYYIGIFECTQRQWNLVMGSNPSSQTGDCRPVENVSCNMIRGSSDTAGAGWPAYGHAVDATSFMGKLQAKTGLTFDLPTNAQWEYACRAGTTTALNSGKNLISTSSDANMDEVGRYKSNQADGKGGYTSYHTKVGSYLPNAWGLYDMHGNVWEFCLDWYSEDSYTTAAVDPVGPSTGTARVACGGCHFNTALACRSARHAGGLTPSGYNNGNGFRVALHPKQDLYVVVDLSSGPDATSYPVRYTNSMPNLDDDTCRTTELWLRKIPAGTFIMGSPEDEVGRNFREIQHQVTLTQDYYIGVFECTQKQWNLVMGNSPSSYTGDCRPVENVSYNMIRGTSATAGAGWPTYGHAVDATSFMGKLQAKTGLTFDLPTEAQWEYACRAGTTTALNSGRNLVSSGHNAAMDEVGRYQDNQSDGKGGYSEHTTVGNYLPNAWGLYDMHGNVWEWCLDWYSNYGTDTVVNPIGPNTGSYRLFRGGSWFTNGASNCRSAYRYNGGYDASFHDHNRGFRIACLP